MEKYWMLLGEYTAESKTFSALAGTPASPFSVPKTGRLKGLRTIVSADAASTLTQHVHFKLSSTDFTPNAIEVGAQGAGLQTVPQHPQGIIDWSVDQPVVAGHVIGLEARNLTADTPVGVTVFLYGMFE